MSTRSRTPERRVDVRVPRAEPVAERRPQQLARGGGRRTLHDEVLAVEEIGRVLWIRRHRPESWKRRERRARPFPSIPDEILDAPRAGTGRMGARRLGIPAREVEHAER